MSLVRIRLRYARADGTAVEIIGWWPSTSVATLTAEADGATRCSAIVLSDLRGIA